MKSVLNKSVVSLCAAALSLAGCAPEGSEDLDDSAQAGSELGGSSCRVPTWTLVTRQGRERGVTMLSSLGSAASWYEADAASPVRGVIARNADGRVLALDHGARTALATPLAALVSQGLAEREHIASTPVPGLGVTVAMAGEPVLEAISRATRVAGVSARTYTFRDPSPGGRRTRITYANGLPRPPLAVRRELARLQRVAESTRVRCDDDEGEDGDALPVALRIAGRAVLRVETQEGATWTSTFQVESVRRESAPCSNFDAPAGWTVATSAPAPTPTPTAPPPAPPRPAGAAALPPTECPPDDTPTGTASLVRGPGPISKNPRVYVLYWGRAFSDPAHDDAVNRLTGSFQSFFATRFNDPMRRSYGINPGSVRNVVRVNEDPPRIAGGDGSAAAVSAFVGARTLAGDGPAFWWSVGGRDPLFAVFVPEDQVESSGWSGFHFLTFNQAITFVPWPFSLIMHQGMPWMLVKVPNAALGPLPASRNSFDEATETASHEFVETVTDPFPFWGYWDPSRIPAWSESEVSDICEDGLYPWAASTSAGATRVSTYWSQADHACVPESRPTLTITNPTDHSVIPWSGSPPRTPLTAFASDPLIGTAIGSDVQWRVDGIAAVQGASSQSHPLVLGAHRIEARLQNAEGAVARACASVEVSAQSPNVAIASPAPGASLPLGAPVTLRATVTDAQDLPETIPLTWRVNGATVGVGTELLWTPGTLGAASLSVTATNSAGLTSVATRVVTVVAPTGAPRVRITAPANETNFGFPSGTVHFTATATDGAGAPLPDASIRWRSDVDGDLGVGASVDHALSGSPCSLYQHRITVTVTDAAGRVATDSITVYAYRIC